MIAEAAANNEVRSVTRSMAPSCSELRAAMLRHDAGRVKRRPRDKVGERAKTRGRIGLATGSSKAALRAAIGGACAVVAALVCPAAAGQIFHGTGTVVAALPRVSRLIVNHPEIKGFMPAMEM